MLSTGTRASVRVSGVMTREEEEEKEVEEMKKHQFKALVLDPRVLTSCGDMYVAPFPHCVFVTLCRALPSLFFCNTLCMGVPRVDKKPVTQAQAPVFKTDGRAGRRPSVM